jgi:hypothetical protein
MSTKLAWANATVPTTVIGHRIQNHPVKLSIPISLDPVSNTNKCHKKMP